MSVKSIYQIQYENDSDKLKAIENRLKELESLSPEEQNRLYFKQQISEEIWRKKYKAESDKSIVDTWKRIAKFLSKNEEKKDIWYLYFFDLLEGFKFTGAGRVIANSDFNKKNVTLQNCYMSSIVDDSIEGIMEVAKEAAIIHKMGGGIGFNFSTIRPKGAKINSTGWYASGPISFAHIYDSVCRTITSIGGRYGAQMLQLHVSHPDIEEFITAKRSTESRAPLTRFNLSVQISDKFMETVKNDGDWDLVFNGTVYKTVKARYLWDLILKHAYDYAEPGIFNIDIANRYNNLWFIEEEKIVGTNPCAEQSLPYNGSCNLGSFNFTQFVNDPFTRNSEFDIYKLKYYVPIAVRFMDNIIDLTQQPSQKFVERQKFARRIGIGFTGLADALVMLGVRYSKDNAEQIGRLAKFLKEMVYNTSVELAKERGPAPALNSKENKEKFLQSRFLSWWIEGVPNLKENILEHGIRNTFLLSVAPTGTISLLMNNISSGIEPIFANSYYRNIKIGEHKTEKREIMDYAYKLWKEMFGDMNLPDYWVTAEDLKIDDHLEIMATVQKHVDTAISKTIIIPEDYPFEDYKHVFEKAYDLELKGVTVYRPNTNLATVLETKKDEEKKDEKKVENVIKKKREFVLSGKTYKLRSPKEKYSYYITINDFIDDEGKVRPFEIFINTKDPRQPIFAFISRLLSALFRRESNLDFIIREMQSTLVHGEGFFDPKDGKHVPSLIAYIGKIIKQHIALLSNSMELSNETEKQDSLMPDILTPIVSVDNENSSNDTKFETCPECGMKGLKVEDGCKVCIYCGYSGCE